MAAGWRTPSAWTPACPRTGSRDNRRAREPASVARMPRGGRARGRRAAPRADHPRGRLRGRGLRQTGRTEGEAFGTRPSARAPGPEQRLRGFQGKGLVNTLDRQRRGPQGKLDVARFTIERDYINFLIGGGNHPARRASTSWSTARSSAPRRARTSTRWSGSRWDVRDLQGKPARIEIVDQHSGDWGHIDIDQIEFCGHARDARWSRWPNGTTYGTMGLALLGADASRIGAPRPSRTARPPRPLRRRGAGRGRPLGTQADRCARPDDDDSNPAQEATATFVVDLALPEPLLPGAAAAELGRHYATRFAVGRRRGPVRRRATSTGSTPDAALARHLVRLDAALLVPRPHVANTSILATSTVPPLRRRPVLRLGGRRLLRGNLHPRLALRPGRGPAVPGAGADPRGSRSITPRASASTRRPGVIGYRGEEPVGAGRRRPGGQHPAGLSRAPDVGRRRRSSKRLWPQIKASLEYLIGHDRTATASSRARSRTRSTPLVRRRALAQLALPRGPAGGRGDGPRDGRRRRSPGSAGSSLDRGRTNLVRPALERGVRLLHPASRIPNMPKAVGSYDGCEIDQVFGQTGRSRSAWAGS